MRGWCRRVVRVSCRRVVRGHLLLQVSRNVEEGIVLCIGEDGRLFGAKN